MMSGSVKPTGHLQIKPDKNGRTRAYFAYWRDAGGKHGRRLGPAHVKDSGRRTPRGAIVWRAGDGRKPSPAHLTPREAEARLEEILDDAEANARTTAAGTASLREIAEGWVAERSAKKQLKRSTVAVYEDIFERLCRDLGGDTPVHELADGRLVSYFAELKAERALGRDAAERALARGEHVIEVKIEGWTAQPPGHRTVEVATKAEAVRLAAEVEGKWKHERPGVYRVVPGGAQRARRVSWGTAQALSAEGWHVTRRVTKRWTLQSPASAATHNKYRATLGAALDYAVRKGWLEANPIAEVDSASTRAARRRILRRDDYFNAGELERLLEQASGDFEEAFWLCGAHAGLRLPGEALGLRWGAVDFQAGVIRPYDNWVRDRPDDTKTPGFEPIPMTPRLARALGRVRHLEFATGDGDFVFAGERGNRPVSGSAMREGFRRAQREAALKSIPMYNLRHSFGTNLASSGVDVRTIQALMRHSRLSTTEQYMAYAPRPDLADQLTRALDPQGAAHGGSPTRPFQHGGGTFLERLEEEIPAKWLREVQRLYTETQGHVSA
jgi:integrase